MFFDRPGTNNYEFWIFAFGLVSKRNFILKGRGDTPLQLSVSILQGFHNDNSGINS